MKILIFNTLYYPFKVGGAEKSVQLLAESLVKEGHRVSVVSSSTNDENFLHNGVEVIKLRHRNFFWFLDENIKNPLFKLAWHSLDIRNVFLESHLKKIVKSFKPDVIHTNNLGGLSSLPWIIAKKENIPVVHTLRDYSLMCPRSTMFKNNDNCNKQCVECRLITKYKHNLTNKGYVTSLIGISEFVKNEHLNNGYFRRTPSLTISNGINIEKDVRPSKPVINKERIICLYIGRLEKTKGVDVLIEAFKKSSLELWLAGEINDDDIKAMLNNSSISSNIKHLGYVNSSEVLPLVDFLIAPSMWQEPFGRVVIEAYNYGIPVIGSNNGGIPELIQNGVTGFVFKNKHDLKDIIKRIEDGKIISEDFLDNILLEKRKYDNQKITKAYIEEYKKIKRV